MIFTSYAQNFEDILLWRALKNIKKGFYIDIGAQDPEVDSVSLAFYQKGWRGIHIEPNEYYFNRLKIARPDEIVEQLVISDQSGTIPFYEIPSSGLSTADFNIAKKHKENGLDFIQKEVNTVSLDFILNKHSLNIVHWLKIDVEGFEKSVIDSWKISECRPWIILVEATKPLTQIESYSAWESILLSKNYHFVYFDGLNRFYIHKDHIELAEHFKFPINVFDNFMLSGLATHNFHNLFTSKAKEADAKAKEADIWGRSLHAQLLAVYASNSWRITAIFRWINTQRKLLHKEGFKLRLKKLIKKIVRKIFLVGDQKNNKSDSNLIKNQPNNFGSLDLSSSAYKIYKKLIETDSSVNGFDK